jgi:GNAT superfamily N-acetyltransferase
LKRAGERRLSRLFLFEQTRANHRAMSTSLSHRIALPGDIPRLRAVMQRAIEHLQTGFLTPAQIAASHKVMGLDSQLVADGTYFVVEQGPCIAGCGGWSFRATLFGGDDSIVAREPDRLDPARDAAKIRAMYTDPDFARRGVGSLVLDLCEAAAREAGFLRAELMGTAAGVPLYESRGYRAMAPLEPWPVDGIEVPLLRMEKALI